MATYNLDAKHGVSTIILYAREISPAVEMTDKKNNMKGRRAYWNAMSSGCRKFRVHFIVELIQIAPAFCHFEQSEKSPLNVGINIGVWIVELGHWNFQQFSTFNYSLLHFHF